MNADEYRRRRRQIGSMKVAAAALGVTKITILRRENGHTSITEEAATLIRKITQTQQTTP